MNSHTVLQTCLVEVGSASCSGIIIDVHRGYVITHGTLLLPYLTNQLTALKQLLKEGHLRGTTFGDLKAQVTVERRLHDHNTNPVPFKCSGNKATHGFTVEPINLVVPALDPSLAASRLVKLEAELKIVWRSDRFAKTLKHLFPSSEWKFLEETLRDGKIEKAPLEISSDHIYHLLPYFVLLKVPLCSDWCHPLAKSLRKTVDHLKVGTNVVVVATPFGNLSPEVFLNSMSSGIISNLAGERRELILTDARCIPGSEGGAIFHGSSFQSDPVGMVVAPLCWKANEWVGLAIGCRLLEILESLKKTFKDSVVGGEAKLSGTVVPTSDDAYMLVENIPLVFISSGSTWGSGVLICQERGVILTCSHVVNGARKVKVRVDVPHFTWHTGEVVYATSEDQVFDIAVVLLKDFRPRLQWPKTISIETDLTDGTEAFVIGHVAFGQEHQLKPTITRGIISKVLFHRNTPLMIQTSCSVNSGASGGALVNKNGQLLGIVVCNAKDKECGATYPHLNLSIPAVTIWSTLSNYMKSGMASDLNRLTLYDPRVKLLWTLQGSEAVSMETIKSRL